MQYKTCTKCGETYPATVEYFYRDKTRSDGLFPHCKRCKLKDAHEYHIKTREQKREYDYNYRHFRRDHLLQLKRMYYIEKRESLLEYQREYRKSNPEIIRERKHQYYVAHRDQIRIRRQTQNREYRLANRERYRIHQSNRNARKRSLPDGFTLEQQAFALEYFGNVCAVCRRPFYDLFSERVLALDHWVPLSSDDCPGTTATNMIPLCHGIDGCNNSKGSRDPEKWLISRFGKRKTREILQRIEAYFEAVREEFNCE